jgi:hypothetical protein
VTTIPPLLHGRRQQKLDVQMLESADSQTLSENFATAWVRNNYHTGLLLGDKILGPSNVKTKLSAPALAETTCFARRKSNTVGSMFESIFH